MQRRSDMHAWIHTNASIGLQWNLLNHAAESVHRFVWIRACVAPPLSSYTYIRTLSGLLHKEPASTERAESHDDETGQRGWAVLTVVQTELRQVFLCLNDCRVKVVCSWHWLGTLMELQWVYITAGSHGQWPSEHCWLYECSVVHLI